MYLPLPKPGNRSRRRIKSYRLAATDVVERSDRCIGTISDGRQHEHSRHQRPEAPRNQNRTSSKSAAINHGLVCTCAGNGARTGRINLLTVDRKRLIGHWRVLRRLSGTFLTVISHLPGYLGTEAGIPSCLFVFIKVNKPLLQRSCFVFSVSE